MSDTKNDDVCGGETANDKEFTFLCLVDDSEELSRAIRFSCRRAARVGGRVALVSVIEPVDFQHWIGVGDLMRAEAREEAQGLLDAAAISVKNCSGKEPRTFIREGDPVEQLIELIEEEQDISLLVLGAAVDKDGPGPIVSYLSGKMVGQLRVPMTVVPGSLTDEEIDAIT